MLFDGPLAADLAPYRRFRHVVFHSYGFQLDWSRMTEGASNVEGVFLRLKIRLETTFGLCPRIPDSLRPARHSASLQHELPATPTSPPPGG